MTEIYFFALKFEIKSVLECKITFLYGDDRNGQKHVRKLMDFFEEGCIDQNTRTFRYKRGR